MGLYVAIVIFTVLLCTNMEAQTLTNAPIGVWQFRTCALDIHHYFKGLFPEYVIPPTGRRLLRDERETMAPGAIHDDDVSELDRRSRARFQAYDYRANDGNSANHGMASMDNPINDDHTNAGIARKLPRFKPTSSQLPPIGAWNQVRMAASGCTSCTNGCCDAVDITLDCGDMRVPLDYASSAHSSIVLRVYRIRVTAPALSSASRKHLWLLQGGPGGSGLSILPLAIPALQYATDILVPDHRGTGRSTRLSCPMVEFTAGTIPASLVVPCVDSGNTDFKKFTVTAAARDLDLMITSARTMFNPTQVFVHGYSYGTRWASRYLQLFPDGVDKVVLEGVVDKDTYFNDFVIGSQYAGTRFMQKCLMNAHCRTFFAETSLASKIHAIVSQGRSNPCSHLWVGNDYSEANIRLGVQVLLYFGLQHGIDGPYANPTTAMEEIVDFRTFSLGMFQRWFECGDHRSPNNNNDNLRSFVAGLSFVLSLYGGLPAVGKANSPLTKRAAINSQELFNDIVYGMIGHGDLRRPMDDPETYAAKFGNIEWGQVEDYGVESSLATQWGTVTYPMDAYMGKSPVNVKSKILFINGEIDGQTPRSSAYKHFSDVTTVGSGSKTIAIISDMGHSATSFGCGKRVLKTFLESSAADTSCAITSELTPVRPLETEFRIPERFSAHLLGSPLSPFTGYDPTSFCESPSPGNQDYCLRCLDNCLLLVDVGVEREKCTCAQRLLVCLSEAKLPNATSMCKSTVTHYDRTVIRNFETCQRSCASGLSSSSEISRETIRNAILGACLGSIVILALVIRHLVYRSKLDSNLKPNSKDGTTGPSVASEPTAKDDQKITAEKFESSIMGNTLVHATPRSLIIEIPTEQITST